MRWQHRLKRERPTCTERNESLLESADGSMATVATRREKNFCQRNKSRTQYEPTIPLTPTGLLMEGDFTQNPCRGIWSVIGILRQLPQRNARTRAHFVAGQGHERSRTVGQQSPPARKQALKQPQSLVG